MHGAGSFAANSVHELMFSLLSGYSCYVQLKIQGTGRTKKNRKNSNSKNEI